MLLHGSYVPVPLVSTTGVVASPDEVASVVVTCTVVGDDLVVAK